MNAARPDNLQSAPQDSMKGALIKSSIFHGLVITIALVGIPFVKTEPLIIAPVSVELVDISELSQTDQKPPPKPKPIPTPEEPKKIEAPEPPKEELKKPEPPKPEPVKEEAVPLPKPEEPKKEPEKPKPKPKEKPKPKPKKEEPKQDDLFNSLLKDLTPTEEEDQNKQKTEVENTSPIPDFDKELTSSELDSLNYGIGRCWQIDGGVRYAEKYKPKIRVYVDPAMNVIRVEPLEPLRLSTDNTYRAVYEKARRALLNDMCKRLELPAEKYGGKYFDLTFDPSSMLGY